MNNKELKLKYTTAVWDMTPHQQFKQITPRLQASIMSQNAPKYTISCQKNKQKIRRRGSGHRKF